MSGRDPKSIVFMALDWSQEPWPFIWLFIGYYRSLIAKIRQDSIKSKDQDRQDNRGNKNNFVFKLNI